MSQGIALTGANQQVTTGVGRLLGVAIHAGGAAACKVRIWDGTSASGVLLGAYDLSASGTGSWADVTFDDDGRRVALGIYVEAVSGTFEGSVFI